MKRIRERVILEVGLFPKDGSYNPRTPGIAPIELPFPWFQPGEKVLVEVTKIATWAEAKKGRRNGKR